MTNLAWKALSRKVPAGAYVEATLSPRQLECLRLAALGQTSLQISADIGISDRTVDEHFRAACKRLGVRNRTQAVAKALALGPLADPT